MHKPRRSKSHTPRRTSAPKIRTVKASKPRRTYSVPKPNFWRV